MSETLPVPKQTPITHLWTVDLETNTAHWWERGAEGVYASVKTPHNEPKFLTFSAFKKLWDSTINFEGNTVLGHNFKYDLHFIHGPILCNIIDTKIGLFLLNENENTELKFNVEKLFGHKMVSFTEMLGSVTEQVADKRTKSGKRKRTRPRTIYEVPSNVIEPYVCDDVVQTERLWFDYIEPNLKRKLTLWRNFFEIQMPMLKQLYYMEERGVEVDIEKAKQLVKDNQNEVLKIDNKLHSLLHEKGIENEINFSSPSQVHKLLYDTLQLPSPPFHAKRKDADGKKVTSKYQTDEQALIWVAMESKSEIPNLILKRRKLIKSNGTFLKPIIEESVDGRLRTNFNQTVARTGRQSSSGTTNFQNQPRGREIRGVYIAKPGDVLVVADASQAELRLLAHYSQDPTLFSAFRNSNTDLHRDTAIDLGLIDILGEEDGRFLGKTANFSLAYDVWADTFRYKIFKDTAGRINLTREEATKIIAELRERYDVVEQWKKRKKANLRRTKSVKTLDGRFRRLPKITSTNWGVRSYAEREGINAEIQGGVADILNRICAVWMLDFVKKYGILIVHDEIVFEIPIEKVNLLTSKLDALGSIITKHYNLSVPFIIDYKIGDNWGVK